MVTLQLQSMENSVKCITAALQLHFQFLQTHLDLVFWTFLHKSFTILNWYSDHQLDEHSTESPRPANDLVQLTLSFSVALTSSLLKYIVDLCYLKH